MPEKQTWRTLFRTIINNPERKQELARELGVNPVTLTRWAENQATPRQSSLQRLLKLLPDYQHLLMPLITEEFPSFTLYGTYGTPEEPPEQSIPADFYQQVVQLLVTLPESRRVWETCRTILRQALRQLDADQNDIAVILTQCVPPLTSHKVRSLRALLGAGKTPWGGNPEFQSAFLGIEMVAGQVVATGQPIVIQTYPNQQQASSAGFGSSCTYPVLRSNRILGTFGVLSALPDYFTPARQQLIEDYAALISIVFPSDMFYDLEAIDLNMLPPYAVQAPYLGTLQSRVQQIMKEAVKSNQPITLGQAEQRAWQQLEDEVILAAHAQA